MTTSPSTSSARPASAMGPGLVALVDRKASHLEIAAYLDALTDAERLAQVISVTGSRVGRLYDAVAAAPALTLDDVVPAGTPVGKTVIHEGRNSLPAFTRFQKRFARGTDGRVVGYNHQTVAFATGPGFFEATTPDETHPGEIIMDYTREPPFFPEGWPAYKHNARGLSNLVYANMKDYCRRVARGVLVGSAFKKGKPQGAWFTLTRQD